MLACAALWPLVGAVVALALVFGLWRVSGIFPDARAAVQEECTHLLLGMSWLPALGFARRCGRRACASLRGDAPLISGSWAFDLALVAAAAALGARAYDAFTAEVSYAPYYAAPLVLLLALLHERIGERWPSARTAALAPSAAWLPRWPPTRWSRSTPTTTRPCTPPAARFMTDAPAAPAFQSAVDFIERRTAPGERILALPADAGLYFMTGRTPALYDVQVRCRDCSTRAPTSAPRSPALRRDRVRYAISGLARVRRLRLPALRRSTTTGCWPPTCARAARRWRPSATPSVRAAGTNPARGFTVFDLRP